MSQTRIIEEELSAKEQRILKTARLYFENDMNMAKIARENDDLPKRETLQRYKNTDFWGQIKRVFSDREKFLLKREIESEIDQADREAKEWLSNAATIAESSRAYTQAAKARMDHALKKVKAMQEIGLYDKPGTQRPESDDEEEEKTEVIFEMDEAVTQKMTEEANMEMEIGDEN